MTSHTLERTWLALVFVAVSASAHAALIAVTPENLQGWSIAVNKGGQGALGAFGPALSETRDGFFSAGDSTYLGRGAFYASCGPEGQGVNSTDKTPSTVWLGLDEFAGQPLAGKTLNQITRMQYYTYVSKIPTRFGSTNTQLWDSWTWWRYPRQPISLQLTAYNTDGDRRQFWYRPWGTTVKGDDNYAQGIGAWLHYDCMARGRWMMLPNYEGELSTSFENWNELISTVGTGGVTYGNYRLVDTTTTPGGFMSAGYKGSTEPPGRPWCTATGKCLNFGVGARFYQFRYPNNEYTNWWSESINFRGHVDHFTLGIDGVENTYDFEPSPGEPTPKVLQTRQKAIDSPVFKADMTQKRYMFKVSGKVANRLNAYFDIDDGSGFNQLTRVYLMYNMAEVGQYWSAWGCIERPRWTEVSAPYIVWTDESHARKLD